MEMTMEILDVVDENGNPTGETVERTVAHKTGVRQWKYGNSLAEKK